MSVTPSTIKTLFPELAAQSDARVQLFLDQASRRSDPDALGAFYDDAVTYLTAHLLAVAQRASKAFASGATGAVTSESVGAISRTYAQAGAAAGVLSYESTPYGVEYSRLLQLAFPTPCLAW